MGLPRKLYPFRRAVLAAHPGRTAEDSGFGDSRNQHSFNNLHDSISSPGRNSMQFSMQGVDAGRAAKAMRRRSIITVGTGKAEVKIYTLKRRDGYPSFQCSWYELGLRKTKTFADVGAAKLFANQTTCTLRQDAPSPEPASFRDFELIRACEAKAVRHGLNLVSAFEEWSDAKQAMNGRPILDAVRFFNTHHSGFTEMPLIAAADEFFAAKKAMSISIPYTKSLRSVLTLAKRTFGSQPIHAITTAQVDTFLHSVNGNNTSKGNFRRVLVTFFKWARARNYLPEDQKTAAQKSAYFRAPDAPPAIFTPSELRKILKACLPKLLPHIVIGAFAGIRSAEIERLEWEDILWDRGYILIKAAKSKTKSRRLVPILPNLRAWLEPLRKDNGYVCRLRNSSVRLNYTGSKAGIGWRQNALRHSFASYRLAEIQDAAKVALELGNTPEKLFHHYRELVIPEAAKEWFSIVPTNVDTPQTGDE